MESSSASTKAHLERDSMGESLARASAVAAATAATAAKVSLSSPDGQIVSARRRSQAGSQAGLTRGVMRDGSTWILFSSSLAPYVPWVLSVW